jgi:cytosine/adenosine deaminase-related metal-dependent hydrolase
MADRATVIRDAGWIVAWNAGEKRHEYRRGGDVAWRGRDLIHVGGKFAGPADAEIDGRGLMVMPGFVNVHSHPSSEPGNKGLLEELGSPGLGQSSLYEFMPVFRLPPDAAGAATRVAIAEMLLSGITTVCDLSLAREGWADELAATGIRAVLCPMFRSASWRTEDGYSVAYSWDEAAGEKALRQAVATIDRAAQHPSGRVSGMLGPSQVDTCTEGLIKEALAAARERGVPIQIHCAQSLVEFGEITRRHGKTPIAWLDSIGALGPDTVLGHGIFLNDHPWVKWPHADDFARLRASGAQVAHCPTVFMRRGIALNTLGRYMRAGIVCGIGTDTFPHSMTDELRNACYAGRVLAGSFTAVSTADVFTAATVGGAAILRRPDLGRLAPGCRADFSLVDLGHPLMRPVRDPLRSLVYSAGERAIRDVYVDGRQVVRGGKVISFDVAPSLDLLQEAQDRALAAAPGRDWARRSVDEMSPPVFPLARP